MTVRYANFVQTSLAKAINEYQTAIEVNSTQGFPSLESPDDYFYAVLIRLQDNSKEIVKVTSYSNNVCNVERAQEGTTGLTFNQGDTFALYVTAASLSDRFEAIETDVDDVESQVQTLETTQSDHGSRINSLEGETDQLQSDVGNIQNDLQNYLRKDSTEQQVVTGPVRFDGEVNFGNAAYAVPVGTIVPFAGASAPSGWVECDGRALSKTTYPDLYQALLDPDSNKCIYGETDDQFFVPDLRGLFIRGWNHFRQDSFKDDTDSRSSYASVVPNPNASTLAGDNIATFQKDYVGPHKHKTYLKKCDEKDEIAVVSYAAGQDTSYTRSEVLDPSTNKSMSETRPKNIALMYIIFTGVVT
ncbi:MAG: hypothetical protein DRH04_06115 [Deltaproteobacteria bacterium]|nr:MAG: hypothetical protein DRH04_06115 [Deltaproteobacteria bacterium]